MAISFSVFILSLTGIASLLLYLLKGVRKKLVALVIFLFGLNAFGVLPFTLPSLTAMLIYVIIVVAGVLLLLGGFLGW